MRAIIAGPELFGNLTGWTSPRLATAPLLFAMTSPPGDRTCSAHRKGASLTTGPLNALFCWKGRRAIRCIGPPFTVCAGTQSLEDQFQCELEVAVLCDLKL